MFAVVELDLENGYCGLGFDPEACWITTGCKTYDPYLVFDRVGQPSMTHIFFTYRKLIKKLKIKLEHISCLHFNINKITKIEPSRGIINLIKMIVFFFYYYKKMDGFWVCVLLLLAVLW